MSDVALSSTKPVAQRTWRDAVTPVGRTSRRRWALGFPALLCLAAATIATSFGDGAQGVSTVALIALVVIFGMLRRSTRRLTAVDHPALDERDRLARDRAFRLAYPLLLGVVVLSLAALVLVLPDATRDVPADFPRGATISIAGWFVRPEALLGIALWFAAWAIFLPTGVLAWTEPDALEPADGLPESLRDGLLAAALGAGVAVGALLGVGFFAALPFLAALALLGALARRDRV